MDKKTLALGFFLAAATAAGGYHYFHQIPAPVVSDQLASLLSQYSPASHLDARTKTTGCQVNGPYPDHACTPGATFPDATLEEICVSGYSRSVRNVSVSTKKKIYASYGYAYPQPRGLFEVDHLIPLAIGGNNDMANLFPEIDDPVAGYKQKDLVENFLHHEVCAGRIDLKAAQIQVANDWVAIYKTLTPEQIQALKREFAFN